MTTPSLSELGSRINLSRGHELATEDAVTVAPSQWSTSSGFSSTCSVDISGFGWESSSWRCLNEIERATGSSVVRGNRRALKTDGLQPERENGKRRASVHDFHSFRVTWITLALAAGVPMEVVQRVTGHRTVAVVMKHYFRPGREDFRAAIFKAMPKMLADGGQRSANDEMRQIIERITAHTWKRDKARLLELLNLI